MQTDAADNAACRKPWSKDWPDSATGQGCASAGIIYRFLSMCENILDRCFCLEIIIIISTDHTTRWVRLAFPAHVQEPEPDTDS